MIPSASLVLFSSSQIRGVCNYPSEREFLKKSKWKKHFLLALSEKNVRNEEMLYNFI